MIDIIKRMFFVSAIADTLNLENCTEAVAIQDLLKAYPEYMKKLEAALDDKDMEHVVIAAVKAELSAVLEVLREAVLSE